MPCWRNFWSCKRLESMPIGNKGIRSYTRKWMQPMPWCSILALDNCIRCPWIGRTNIPPIGKIECWGLLPIPSLPLLLVREDNWNLGPVLKEGAPQPRPDPLVHLYLHQWDGHLQRNELFQNLLSISLRGRKGLRRGLCSITFNPVVSYKIFVMLKY
jgi:hypothetical protein